MRIDVVATAAEFARRAADLVCGLIQQRSSAVIGLASGRTPLGLYAELARRVGEGALDLSRATAFAVDELYGVRRDHPATNATYFRQHLTELIPLRALHLMDSEAEDAEAECARFLRLIEAAGRLDLAVLGIGLNGHIAFNEPGSPLDSHARKVALDRTTRATYARHFSSVDETPGFGLTLGVADLLAARSVLLLASGADKSAAVMNALEGPVSEAVPASALQRHGDLTVLLDQEAAALLRRVP